MFPAAEGRSNSIMYYTTTTTTTATKSERASLPDSSRRKRMRGFGGIGGGSRVDLSRTMLVSVLFLLLGMESFVSSGKQTADSIRTLPLRRRRFKKQYIQL